MLILIGFQNSGKTTLGKMIAEKLMLPFWDTDGLIEEAYLQKHSQHLNVREIFQMIGCKNFRRLEQRILAALVSTKGVLATGGGMVCRLRNRQLVQKMGQVIYIRSPLSILYQRALINGMPAFINGDFKNFKKIYQKREALYRQVCACIVETEGKSMETIVMELIDAYGK